MTTRKKTTPPKLTPQPRKDYRPDYASTFISGLAGGFVAQTLSNFSANLERKASLFSLVIHPTGRVEVKGRWIEWMRKQPLLNRLAQLVSPLHEFRPDDFLPPSQNDQERMKRNLPHPMSYYCQHIKTSRPYMICLKPRGHSEPEHRNGSFTWKD